MYKSLGLQFMISQQQTERLYAYMTRLGSFHKRINEHFKVEDNKLRQSYRLPIEDDFPPEFTCQLWLMTPDRKIKLRIKDLSIGGCNAILPFEDKDAFSQGRVLNLILRLNTEELIIQATIKRVDEIRLSSAAKKFLTVRFNNAKYFKVG